jgi:Raf kinase inhibitor-like YbhB/YbcL family protein
MTQTHTTWISAAFATALVGLIASIGCQGNQPAASKSADKTAPVLSKDSAVAAKLQITSTAFIEGQPVPKKYTSEGEDLSPPLAWAGLPKGTKELALICDDPDAPSPKAPAKEPWVHWVIYGIPANATGLPEGVPRELRLKEPPGALQGKNSWPKDNVGYRGPQPPVGSGTHRYFFKLYALDALLATEPGLDKAALLKAMEGHILGEGQLIGTYEGVSSP